MATIKIPVSPNYERNYYGLSQDGSEGPCVICGKPVKAPAKFVIHEVDGGGLACTPDEDEKYGSGEYSSGDMGAQPIGPDCIRRHPELKPYIRKR